MRVWVSLVWLVLACGVWAGESRSFYVTMDDGVKLAVDVHYPEGFEKGTTYPALMELTRYWRAAVDPSNGNLVRALRDVDRVFLKAGYVLVKVDTRGSGASFGHRLEEYGPREVMDGYALIDWVVAQDWSDGKVGAFGTSYSGTTAELLTASNHPALKAVIPGWSDFDVYTSPARPYGLMASGFIRVWSNFVGMLDRNDIKGMGASVRPVDPELLDKAIADHKQNPDVFEVVSRSDYRDVGHGNSAPMAACSSIHWRKQIEESGVPMLVLASWFDAGVTEGALLRFQHYKNPQKLVIMATRHGGSSHASPYKVSSEVVPPDPSEKEQFQMRLDFFDYHLKGKNNGVADWPAIQYYNLGEETMRQSQVWPVKNSKNQTWFLNESNQLSKEKPTQASGSDTYQVDFGVSTGDKNRWMTQMGNPILNLDNRAAMNQRMLTYTTPPLTEDTQITGAPVVNLHIASTETDGAFLVYLEDIDESGQVRYITEGGLRGIHRKQSKDPEFPGNTPYHSFAKADAAPIKPGEVMTLTIKLHPTSVKIKKCHRLRLSLAGADAAIFDRIPKNTTPTWTLHRNQTKPSSITLPVIQLR